MSRVTQLEAALSVFVEKYHAAPSFEPFGAGLTNGDFWKACAVLHDSDCTGACHGASCEHYRRLHREEND